MPDRRTSILDAALQVFVEKGYSSATIADIRALSGATTGSIYHFFDGKPSVAIAIWKSANDEWERLSISKRTDDTPKTIVQATVIGLAEWALNNRALFLFYEELRIRALTDPDLIEIREISKDGAQRATAVYAKWVSAGVVYDLPWPLASALIVGPTYDYLRKSGDLEDPSTVIPKLAECAWAAVCRQGDSATD
ncbi:MAG: TetR/AcrR family transcriptional regulator [Pseudomonadota bacterium]